MKKVLNSDRFVVTGISGSTRSRRPYEGVVSVDKMKPYNKSTGSDIECYSDSS
jgi:hypothetical protein